jgi:hypothetical protein
VDSRLVCKLQTCFGRTNSLILPCGLYYKPMMILNDDSRVISKLETSLTDNARVVIYYRHMLIVQATGISDEEEMWRQSQSSHFLKPYSRKFNINQCINTPFCVLINQY